MYNLAQWSQGVHLSFDSFNFDQRIASGIESSGYTTPTPIQEQSIPIVLEGRDLLGLAQTGTGKTAAFVLPMMQRLMEQPHRGGPRRVRALILAPTRELAEQTNKAIADLGAYTNIKSTSIYGGVSKRPQASAIRRGVDILVACPGRLLDHMRDRSISLADVNMLVLDEADRMCDMGFLPDIRLILEQVPQQAQTLFFSATMPNDIRRLASDILQDPETVQVGLVAPPSTISHALCPVTDKMKKSLLLKMLATEATGRVLIFTRTKFRAKNLAKDLENRKFKVSALQGNMAQNKRQRAIDGFRNGTYDILVATDVASRGIDVNDIGHVINFDMPDTVDAYTHRIGRTGRAEQAGEAFTFNVPEDEGMVREIERALKMRIERRRIADFDYGGFVPDVEGRPAPQSRNGRQSQGRPFQGRAPQGRPGQGRPGQGRAGQGRSAQGRPPQGRRNPNAANNSNGPSRNGGPRNVESEQPVQDGAQQQPSHKNRSIKPWRKRRRTHSSTQPA